MFKWNRAQVLPIGLDIGFESVKLIQCQIDGNVLRVVAAARANIPDTHQSDPSARLKSAIELIPKLLKQQPFEGDRIVACIPRSAVEIKNLRLPPIPADELDQVVQFEARNLFGLEADQGIIQYIPAGEVRQGQETRQEIIAMGARNSEVNSFLETMNGTGTVIEALDVEPCAIFRAFERFMRRKEDEQDVQVIVDIGSRRTQVIIARGRDISFYKSIDLGSNRLHEAVSKKLNISEEEARGLRRRLMDSADAGKESASRDRVRQAVIDATRTPMEELGREISLCLRYYSVTFRGQRPSRVRIVGGEGNDARLIASLNSTLTVPVECGRPLANVDCSAMRANDRSGSLSEWTLALGLALKTTKQNFAPLNGRSRAATPKPEPIPAELAAGETQSVPATAEVSVA